MKIGRKLFLIIMGLNLAGFAALVGTIVNLAYRQIDIHINNEISNLTSENALFIKTWFESHLVGARSLSQIMERYEEIEPLERRSWANRMLRAMVEDNPEVIGACTVWEPNALDGLDAQFAGAPGSDDAGRFVPYWSKTKVGAQVEPLVGYDVPGEGEYYLIPKETGNEALTGPYFYPIDGVNMFMSTVTAPIKNNGHLVGIVTRDIEMSIIQQQLGRIKPYEGAVAALYNNNGLIAGHFDPARVGKLMMETEQDFAGSHLPELIQAIQKGERFSFIQYVPQFKRDMQFICIPFVVGNSTTPWALMIGIPRDIATAPLYRILRFAIIIAVITLLLVSVVVLIVTRSITKPIAAMSDIFNNFNTLDLKQFNRSYLLHSLPRNILRRHDEISSLTGSFLFIFESIKMIIDNIELITWAIRWGLLWQEVETRGLQGNCLRIVTGMNTALGLIRSQLELIPDALALFGENHELSYHNRAMRDFLERHHLNPHDKTLLAYILSSGKENEPLPAEAERLFSRQVSADSPFYAADITLSVESASVDTTREYSLKLVNTSCADNRKIDAVVCVMMVISDVTILTKAKQEAYSASKAKSQFLASMSHEIRTPMNAIIGMSDLMRTDNLDEVQLSYFSDIKKMAKSLLQIINDILDFSKIEVGKLEIIPVHYNIHGLYDNIVSMSKYTASMKELELRHSFDSSIPEAVFGDEIRVRQIITNVVNNAIKYTRTGFVSIDMKRIRKDEGDFIQITVQDSGIGIKKEDFPKLFGTFQQLDAEKNRGIIGTGLGLSITKNLITLMNGEITFDSEYGVGTTFTVTLPLVEGDPDKIELKEISERVTAKDDVAVLVVDDNSINLTVASGFLGTHSIFPDTAVNGFEAIEKVKAKRYDLVFMDHMMPGMDGTEATKRIRELGGDFKTLPIVALSANAVSGAYETFMEAGMNDFISKPIEALQLNAMLLKYLPPEKIAVSKPSEEEAGPEQAILDELGQIGDLDVNAGLSHIGNNKTAYIKILRQFCAEFDGYIADIQRFWSEEDWKEYSIRLHAMKGVFANIGVESISKWAYTLEYASKHGDADLCLKETEAICEAMNVFREKLLKTSLMDTGERKEKQAISAEALSEKLDAVIEACRRGNTDAADKLGEELSVAAFSETVDPLIAELCELISFLDYDVAINKAKEIAENIAQTGAVQ
jgi:signal transduction histidine kinase/CheY-like chemotaxis protein/HPt (histidine-containing phosphotransfer) domain-containing protein